MKNVNEKLLILAYANRERLEAKKASPIDKLVNLADTKLGVTLIPVVSDTSSSSLLYWGRNDDPAPGTVEQLVHTVYKVASPFKHRSLAIGIMNELKSNNLYISINYVQRTIFIARI